MASEPHTSPARAEARRTAQDKSLVASTLLLILLGGVFAFAEERHGTDDGEASTSSFLLELLMLVLMIGSAAS